MLDDEKGIEMDEDCSDYIDEKGANLVRMTDQGGSSGRDMFAIAKDATQRAKHSLAKDGNGTGVGSIRRPRHGPANRNSKSRLEQKLGVPATRYSLSGLQIAACTEVLHPKAVTGCLSAYPYLLYAGRTTYAHRGYADETVPAQILWFLSLPLTLGWRSSSLLTPSATSMGSAHASASPGPAIGTSFPARLAGQSASCKTVRHTRARCGAHSANHAMLQQTESKWLRRNK